MSEHTEGPWFTDGNYIAHQSGDIATLDGVRPAEEEEANARLIAAAPELLEALDALLWAAAEKTLKQKEEIWEQARRAIAKAKGGSEGEKAKSQ